MAPQKESRLQRVKSWLCKLLKCPDPVPAEPTVLKIVGTNKECWVYDGLNIEAEVFTDRIVFSVFVQGRRLLKGWVYHTSDGAFAYDHAITYYPNYRLRNHLRDYAQQRLQQNADQHKDTNEH